MTKSDQTQLLSNYMDAIKKSLLGKSDQWPEEWDGFELRWLVEEAIKYETPEHRRMGMGRYRAFLNEFRSNNLY